MSSAYQPNIPTGTVNLDQDYLNIQGNFQQLDTSFGENHVPFSVDSVDNPAGYHTEINFVPFSTTATNPPNNYPLSPTAIPTVTTGFGQLFSSEINDGFNSDTALFFLTGGNRLQQLTSNIVPSLAINGYTFLPGGILLQWGRKTVATGTGTVTFATNNIAFPNNCWNVIAVPFYTGAATTSASQAVYIKQDTLSNTKFDYDLIASSSSIKGFFWVAIGN